ncbi:hypothetical protein BSLG_004356 [Batrachochytrium salamandrivorans]|nr:hypothetical protein BSLG_004356 [Batrachochytrium salamandrivorans]
MSHIFKRICARKPIGTVSEECETSDLKRPLTALDLTLMGVGGIIGAGIFVLTGKAARQHAGPAIMVSFLISGTVSGLACLCYAELGSTLPVSGSAYSFAYSALGEVLAWIVGWDLMIEYLVGAAAVAVGWGAYLDIFLGGLAGKQRMFDQRYSTSPFIWYEDGDVEGKKMGFYMSEVTCPDGTQCTPYFNIPGFLIMLALTALLCYGMRESAWINNILTAVNMLVCVVFILAGIKFINPANYSPFLPPEQGHGHYGISGLFQGSIIVFFSYIGFDALTTTSQECANPQRDLPIGIICSLTICTFSYIAVTFVLTGMVHYTTIDINAPVSQALIDVGLPALATCVSFGIMCGLTTVLLVAMIGQPRIFYCMAVDGLVPEFFGKVDKKTGTPYVATIICGVIGAFLAGLLPIDFLGNLTSVGTLSAFFMVSVSTLVLRITEPDLKRSFKIPGGFWVGGVLIPGLSAFCSAALFSQASSASILRVVIWMALGLVVYGSYGYHHSKLGKQISGKAAGNILNEKYSGETKA